jgi:hypothetical protein
MNAIRRLTAAGLITVLTAGLLTLTAVQAQAYVVSAGSGQVGVVIPSADNFGTCAGTGFTAQVSSPHDVYVYAAAKYMNYDQTFYAQQVVERYVNGAWTSNASLGGAVNNWTSTSLPAHQQAQWYDLIGYDPTAPGYRQITFGVTWNITQPGFYRIRYEFRWYIGASLIGWTQSYANASDIMLFGPRARVGTVSTGAAFCQLW